MTKVQCQGFMLTAEAHSENMKVYSFCSNNYLWVNSMSRFTGHVSGLSFVSYRRGFIKRKSPGFFLVLVSRSSNMRYLKSAFERHGKQTKFILHQQTLLDFNIYSGKLLDN